MENRNRISRNRNAMTRGRFVRTAGVGAAGIAAAGLGMSGAAKAVSDKYGRPLSDWLLNNPYGFNLFGGKYALSMGLNPPMIPLPPPPNSIISGPLAFPGGPWNSVQAAPYPDPFGITSGSIIERVLPDGRAEITACINVQNGPLTVYRVGEWLAFRKGMGPEPVPVLGEGADGSIDYSLMARFVNPGPNMEIAFILDYSNGRVPGGKMESLSYHGRGHGTFTAHAADFPDLGPNAPGTIGILHLPGHHMVKASNDGNIEVEELILE